MTWVRVLEATELNEGERQVAQIDDRQVLIIRVKSEVYAVSNRCPHMGARLSRGKVSDEGTITCPLHGSSFRLDSGKVTGWATRPPVIGRLLGLLRKQTPLTVYRTKVEDGGIWIEV